jgi:hypothetical protein
LPDLARKLISEDLHRRERKFYITIHVEEMAKHIVAHKRKQKKVSLICHGSFALSNFIIIKYPSMVIQEYNYWCTDGDYSQTVKHQYKKDNNEQ